MLADDDLELTGRLSERDLPVLGLTLDGLMGASDMAYLRVPSMPLIELPESSSASSTCAT